MDTMRLAGLIVASLTLGMGCTYRDTEPPGAPLLETAPGRVRAAAVVLRGWAEPGATVAVTRSPALEPAPTPVRASEFSGAFQFAAVPLAAGVPNVFSFQATDEAGNAGEASTLTLELDERPAGLRALLVRNRVIAGAAGAAGRLEVAAVLDGGSEGYGLADRSISFVVTGPADVAKTATTDAAGRASAIFEGLTTPGAGTVVVRVGDEAAGVTADPLAFEVVSGPAASLQLQLRPAAGGDAGSAVTVEAGAAVEAVLVAKDGADNRLNLPVVLSTSAPGAFFEGARLTGLTKVGTWSVVASVNGVPTADGAALVATGTVTVEAGEASRIVLEAPASVVAGEAFPWSARLEDSFGNAAATPPTRVLTVTTTLPVAEAEVDAATGTAIFRRAGGQVLTAALSGGTTPAEVVKTVLVVPATPASVDVTLAGTDAVPATELLDVAASASATVAVTATAKDTYGNPVAAAISLTTDGPALFDGTTLRRLTTAGSYEVRATVPGTLAAGRRAYAVVAAAPSRIQLALAASQADAGTGVRYTTVVSDEFGNRTTDAVELLVGALPAADFAVDAVSGVLTVRRAGEHVVTARSGRAGSGVAGDTRSLSVRAASPATVTIDVGPNNNVRAGETPAFVATARDSFQNVVANPPLALSVVAKPGTPSVAPGPIVSGGLVYNLTRPGSYLCLAQVIGSTVANDAADPEATLTVTPNVATSVSLQLERTNLELGTPIRFAAAMKDAYGNDTDGTLVVSVRQGAATLASAVTSGTYVPPAAGAYTVVATGTATGSGVPLPSVTGLVTVSAVADLQGPQITFVRPANNPTIVALPDTSRVTPNGCSGNDGDLVSVTLSDPSNVSQYWFEYGGLIASQPGAAQVPALAVPTANLALDVPLCASQLSPATRGELLVKVAGTDVRGNFRESTGSWCVDPDADAYQPTAGATRRCAVVRAATGLGGLRSLAANKAGDLVAARDGAGGVATLQLFARAGTYGLGAAHALGGATAPEGVAFAGRTAFTAVVDGSRAVVTRTRGLDGAGAGADDDFVALAVAPGDRFRGVALAADGSLLVTVGRRNTEAGGSIYRFAGALDYSARYTALPATPVASSTTARFARLCEGLAANEFYVTGYVPGALATDAMAALFRLDTTESPGTLAQVWADTVANRSIGDCAATSTGVVVTLATATSAQVVRVDLGAATLASPALFTGWAAATALEAAPGVARAGSYLFIGAREAANGSLLRFARDGGP